MSNDRGVARRKGESPEQRRERLAAELRANLARRKAQARARGQSGGARSGDGDPSQASPGGGKESPAGE